MVPQTLDGCTLWYCLIFLSNCSTGIPGKSDRWVKGWEKYSVCLSLGPSYSSKQIDHICLKLDAFPYLCFSAELLKQRLSLVSSCDQTIVNTHIIVHIRRDCTAFG